MTEQHIKQLQKLLSESQTEAITPELDQRILRASRERPTHLAHTRESESSLNWLASLLPPLGVMRNATIAVSLTLACFIGMSQLVSFDQDDLVTIKASEVSLQNVHSESGDESKLQKQRINKPVSQSVTQAPSQFQRDKALLDSIQIAGLPESMELLATIDFAVDADRIDVQISIDVAMNDIQSMLLNGEFGEARERYVQLKQVQLKPHCPPCRLPDSLDELLMAQADAIRRTG